MRIAILLAIGLLLSSMAASADDGFSFRRQAALEDLVVCYARGTDLLGSAVNAVNVGSDLDSTINTSDPVFAEALATYRRCFSDKFSFTLEFDGVPALTVPDPATRGPDTDAALQWANFVNNAFRGPGYKSTQHHMGSISSEIDGRRGRIVSYLIATHVFGPDGAEPDGSVSVVNGTYSDRAVFAKGHWRIKQRTLNIISSVVTRAE
jgi:hypothetical protein